MYFGYNKCPRLHSQVSQGMGKSAISETTCVPRHSVLIHALPANRAHTIAVTIVRNFAKLKRNESWPTICRQQCELNIYLYTLTHKYAS